MRERSLGGSDRREEARASVGARVTIWIGKDRLPGHLRNLSRYGAYVCCEPPPGVGAIVKLVLEGEHEPRVLAMGLVAYQIKADSAARLRTPPGIGVQFQQPLSTSARPPRPPPRGSSRVPTISREPTRRMIPPMLSELRGACRTAEDAAPRFAGELAEVGVPYLLAMVERTQRSCRLRLTCGSAIATLDFADGAIITAQLSTGELAADDVVSLVLRWKEGTFAMSPPAPRTRTAAAKSIAQHLVELERGAAVPTQAPRRSAAPRVR